MSSQHLVFDCGWALLGEIGRQKRAAKAQCILVPEFPFSGEHIEPGDTRKHCRWALACFSALCGSPEKINHISLYASFSLLVNTDHKMEVPRNNTPP